MKSTSSNDRHGNPEGVSRRSFLARSGMAAASVGALSAGASTGSAADGGDPPQNIIHLVSDGMSMGTLTCADYLSHLLRKRGLRWVEILNDPGAVNATMNMRPLNSYVTDSSAASSSWGSGSRIANGGVNMLPDGRRLKSLYEILKAEGWQRGLVTTTEITHATPAGFAANVPKRSMAPIIARQYLEHKVEVLLGGGAKHFDAEARKDKHDLYGDYRAAGYTVMKSAADLAQAPAGGRWLGTFSHGHLPYTVDHLNDEELKKSVPTLAEMTGAALRRLQGGRRFILQVEGGRVDHGCHTCDAVAAFRDQIAFDEALEVCLDFRKAHPDTLIVITTDHGNGNPGLNGTGANYVASSLLFANLKDATASFSVMFDRMGREPSSETIRKVILEATGYKVRRAQADAFAPFLTGKGGALYSMMNKSVVQLGQLMANHWAVGWAGNAHTADFVPLTAIGPGAERFHGFIQNTDVFAHYMTFAGVDFRNPAMPLMVQRGAAPKGALEPVEEYWQPVG